MPLLPLLAAMAALALAVCLHLNTAAAMVDHPLLVLHHTQAAQVVAARASALLQTGSVVHLVAAGVPQLRLHLLQLQALVPKGWAAVATCLPAQLALVATTEHMLVSLAVWAVQQKMVVMRGA